jgi:hypothetical protein
VASRWRVAHDRLARDKGYLNDVRIVVRAAEPPGQPLLADFMGSRRQKGLIRPPQWPLAGLWHALSKRGLVP